MNKWTIKLLFVEQVTKLVSCGLDATWMRTNSLNGRVVNFHPAALGPKPEIGLYVITVLFFIITDGNY